MQLPPHPQQPPPPPRRLLFLLLAASLSSHTTSSFLSPPPPPLPPPLPRTPKRPPPSAPSATLRRGWASARGSGLRSGSGARQPCTPASSARPGGRLHPGAAHPATPCAWPARYAESRCPSSFQPTCRSATSGVPRLAPRRSGSRGRAADLCLWLHPVSPPGVTPSQHSWPQHAGARRGLFSGTSLKPEEGCHFTGVHHDVTVAILLVLSLPAGLMPAAVRPCAGRVPAPPRLASYAAARSTGPATGDVPERQH